MFRTFADYAPAMRREGWAVLPSAGKSPIRSGFNSWRKAPSVAVISQWAERDPDADIVYVAGLCETGRNNRGIIVVDADDADAIGQAEEIFGETPGKVRTRRGQHRLFDGHGIDLGKLTGLRKLGLNIDIKHGKNGAGIVAAPPSAHEKDRTFHYAWEDCDETVIRHLPPFPLRKLKSLLEKHEPATQKAELGRRLRDDSRKQGLNDYGVRQVSFCADWDEFLDVCRTWNENLANHYALEPLEDEIVISRASVVWQHHLEGRFVPMIGKGRVAKTKADEVDTLLALNPKHAGDALLLLTKLKIWHAARCRRDETFPVCVKAMASDDVLPGWTRERYQNAKELLLEAGLLKCISEFRNTRDGRDAALYSL